jgi:hypothetical protein
MRKYLLALTFLIAGCTVEPDTVDRSSWQVLKAAGGAPTYIVPLKLDDGTLCIVVMGNEHYSGRAVDCNWK